MSAEHRTYLGVGWKFPVRINPGGGFSFSYYEENVQEAIWVILSTAKGERQMLPDFGCGIHDYVFASNTVATQGTIAHAVRLALTEWEPRIDILDVNVDGETGPNLLLIRIDYRIRSNNSLYNLVYPFFIQEGKGA
jgi:phage baseplate assembly protein W